MFIRRLLFIIIALAMVPLSWASEDFFVQAQVDRDTVNVGDGLVYTVEVKVAGETQMEPDIILPSFGQSFQVGDIFTRSSISILNGKTFIVYFKEVNLIAKSIGSQTIPEGKVELINPTSGLRQMYDIQSVSVNVNASQGQAAAATPTPEIDVMRPIKKRAQITLRQWVPVTIALLLISGIIGLTIYLKQRPISSATKNEEPVDTRTPEQKAFDGLEEAIKLKEAGQINEYFTALSSVLRKYLAEQYQIKAEETTTKELMREMENNGFKTAFMERYREYAMACDQVKYAGIIPSPEEVDKAFPEVKSIIQEKDVKEAVLETENEDEGTDQNSDDINSSDGSSAPDSPPDEQLSPKTKA